MKKFFTTLSFLITFSTLFFLIGCSKKDVDPYQAFRGKTSNELFYSGEEALAKGNATEAVNNFEALEAIYPFGTHSQQAALDIIYAYYKNDNFASAIAAADRYVRLYPQGPHLDYAYYMRGIVNFQSGLSWLQRWAKVNVGSRDVTTLQQSFVSFATVVKLFPPQQGAGNYSYSADALLRMRYIRNLLAQREVNIAQFYMKRKAYVAAANRASYVVQHFQESPEVIKALAVLIQAYQALHLTQMAKSTYRLLQMNYPNAPELKSVGLSH